jgi:hypothetical protein
MGININHPSTKGQRGATNCSMSQRVSDMRVSTNRQQTLNDVDVCVQLSTQQHQHSTLTAALRTDPRATRSPHNDPLRSFRCGFDGGREGGLEGVPCAPTVRAKQERSFLPDRVRVTNPRSFAGTTSPTKC